MQNFRCSVDVAGAFSLQEICGEPKTILMAHTYFSCNQISYAFMWPINIKPKMRKMSQSWL